MKAVTPTLPRLSTLEATYLNALARVGGAFDVCLGAPEVCAHEAPTRWRVTLAPTPPTDMPELAALQLAFIWRGHRYALSVPAATIAAWTNARFPKLDTSSLPDAWHDFAPTLMTEVLVAALRAHAAERLPLSDCPAVESGDQRWRVSAHSEVDGRIVDATLQMSTAACAALAAHLATLPVVPDDTLATIPIMMHALVGRCTLGLDECALLRVGDVIILDDYADPQADEHWLMTDGGDAFSLRPCPRGGTVTHMWKHCMSDSFFVQSGLPGAGLRQSLGGGVVASPESSNYSAYAPDPVDGAAFDDPYGALPAAAVAHQDDHPDEIEADELPPEATDLDEFGEVRPDGLAMSSMGSGYALLSEQGMPLDPRRIGVQLMFDVGEYKIPLCDLLVLRVGAVIDLGQTFSTRAVRVRSAGRVIGEGELVDIDGRVGVRITRWSGERQ